MLQPQVALPYQIVEQLDKYIIGQDDAKRAVAIYTKLRSKDLAEAQAVLKECEEGNG